jgi:hypothetical protein
MFESEKHEAGAHGEHGHHDHDHHHHHHHEHDIIIHIDHKKYETEKRCMTGAELRRLPTPPIGPEYDLWLETPGPGDDEKIQDTQEVHLKSGMSFYSVLGKVNPGASNGPA